MAKESSIKKSNFGKAAFRVQLSDKFGTAQKEETLMMPAPLPIKHLMEANNESCSEESKSNHLRASRDLALNRPRDTSTETI